MRAAIVASISVGLLLAAVLFKGCGQPVPIGTFRGSRSERGRPGADPVVVAQLNRVILKLDANGNGTLEDAGIPWEGYVSRSGNQLEMAVDALNGINIDRQAADISRSLKFTVVSDNEIDYGEVRLERAVEN